MQIGEIKVAESIVTLEVQIKYLEQILNYLIDQNKNTLNYPSQKLLDEFSAKALKQIQNKYPSMGIKKNS